MSDSRYGLGIRGWFSSPQRRECPSRFNGGLEKIRMISSEVLADQWKLELQAGSGMNLKEAKRVRGDDVSATVGGRCG